MITRAQKQKITDGLIEKFNKAQGVYVLDYQSINVEDLTNFRRKLSAEGVDFQVAKNTLMKRALKEVESFDFPDEKLTGQSAVAFSYDDPVAPAKLIKDYLEKEKKERPVLKVASIEGQLYDGSKLAELAKMPSREDMIAGIVGSLDAPMRGIVGALDQAEPLVRTVAAVTRDLISVIHAVAEKQNEAA